MLASSTGSSAHDSAAVTTRMPSVVAVRATTSSIVIRPAVVTGAGGAPAPCWA